MSRNMKDERAQWNQAASIISRQLHYAERIRDVDDMDLRVDECVKAYELLTLMASTKNIEILKKVRADGELLKTVEDLKRHIERDLQTIEVYANTYRVLISKNRRAAPGSPSANNSGAPSTEASNTTIESSLLTNPEDFTDDGFF